MLIDRLPSGSVVTLEIVIGDKKYDISSMVTGTSHNSVLVETVHASKGVELLSAKELHDAVYNLYTNDSEGKRIGWHNVTVKSINYKNHSYSGIFTKGFNQNSTISDRRDNDRIRLDSIKGKVETNDGNVYDVEIHDISDHGLAFIGDKNNYLNKRITVHIDDVINNEHRQINVDCTCVRYVGEEGKALYGCNIGDVPRPFLMYLSDKKLELKKEAFKKATANTRASEETEVLEDKEDVKKVS